MSRVMVRYRVRPDCAAENERLVREVFEALTAERPEGISYESVVLSDGVTFVHVFDGDDTLLRSLPAFQRFSSTVGARCQDHPVQTTVRRVGRYDGGVSS